jgi:hypothetical protein
MKRIEIATLILTAVILSTCTLEAGAQSSQTSFQTIAFFGTIGYSSNSSFVYRGTNIGTNILLQGYYDYIPNTYEIFQDLGINMLIVNFGTEGGSPFNINLTPNWAQNFDSLLTKANSYGIKIVMQELGNPNNNLAFFGIQDTLPLATAKAMVDKLAGNNALNHNFLTDPRIAFWIIDNEPNLGNATLRQWLCDMGDYFLSYRANVACVGGYVGLYNNEADTIPLFAGHQNFIVIHHYPEQIAQNAQDTGQSVYDASYYYFLNRYEGGRYINCVKAAIDARGNIPVSNIILGEAGLGHEPNFSDNGVTYHFTEATRGEHYRAMFQACKDGGIGGVAPYLLFDAYYPSNGFTDNWGAVAANGTYYPALTNQYKAFYRGG